MNFTFDTFIESASNRTALGAARGLHSANPAPLFLCGRTGTGKTHLLRAIEHSFASVYQPSAIRYLTADSYMAEVLERLRSKEGEALPEDLATCEVVLFDNFQILCGKLAMQHDFTQLFDALANAGKRLVIAADAAPDELSDLRESLRDRLRGCLVVEMQTPYLADRVMITRRKAESYGLELRPDVVEFVAERTQGSVRNIEGMLRRYKLTMDLAGRDKIIDLETMSSWSV